MNLKEFEFEFSCAIDSSIYENSKNNGCLQSAQKTVHLCLSNNQDLIKFINSLIEDSHEDLLFIPLLSYYNRLPLVMARTLQFAFNKSCPPYESYFSGQYGGEGMSILKNGEPTLHGKRLPVLVLDKKMNKSDFISILERDHSIRACAIIYTP